MTENATRVVLNILARLIALLAARGIYRRAEMLELVEIAKRRGRG